LQFQELAVNWSHDSLPRSADRTMLRE
jgi:hypothetical protein